MSTLDVWANLLSGIYDWMFEIDPCELQMSCDSLGCVRNCALGAFELVYGFHGDVRTSIKESFEFVYFDL